MSLWDEAREVLRERLLEQKEDAQRIEQFLHEKVTAEDAKHSALDLQKDSDRKYGTGESRGKGISAKWIRRIMENLGNFITYGDAVMTAAPESAALVWFGIKQVLAAIQNDYRLYSLFNGALIDITEVMVLVRTYDKLYHKHATKNDGSIYDELCKVLREIYVSMLDFSYAVKKHITAGKRGKLVHALQNVVGDLNRTFEDKINTIQTQKNKVIERSQAAFQERAQDQLGAVSGGIQAVQDSVGKVLELHRQSTNEWKEIMSEMKSAKASTHRDIAIAEYEKTVKLLVPVIDSSSMILEQRIDERHDETCGWVLDLPAYKNWAESTSSCMLVLTGEASCGKSIVGAHIFETLHSELESDGIILEYVSYNAIGDEEGVSSRRVWNTILRRFYEYALVDLEDDDLTLQKCNSAFTTPKQAKDSTHSGRGKDAGRQLKTSTEYFDNPEEVCHTLISILKKPVHIVIDVVDALSDAEKATMADCLVKLLGYSDTRVQILLICRSSNSILDKLGHVEQVNTTVHARESITQIVANSLKDIPGLSRSERDEIEQAVTLRAGHDIRYVKQVALPFLSTPLRRPVTTWVAALPEHVNETYHEHLLRLAPAYRDLLQFVLSMTLVAQSPLLVEEAMDAYTKLYLNNDARDGQEIVTSNTELYRKQIQMAGGPFLVIRDGDFIALQDPIAVRRYCVSEQGASPDSAPVEGELCASCRLDTKKRSAIVISERDEHLNMAILCLKHLNSAAFRARHYTSESITEAGKRANKRLGISDDEPDESSNSSAGEESTDSSVNDEDEVKADADAESKDASEGKESADDNDTSLSEVNDADASIFSEQGEDYDAVPEDSDWDGYSTYRWRYEMSEWQHHVREAERLWKPEERSSNPNWQVLEREMKLFFFEAPLAFEAWKLEIVAYHREVWDPIFFGAHLGLTSLVELALDHGAKISDMTNAGITVLLVAVGAPNQITILRLLLAKGADPNFEGECIPPFHDWLCYDPDLECVKELVSYGASCETANKTFGWNAAHYVGQYGTKTDVLRYLVENEQCKIDINSLDKEGEAPIHRLLGRQKIPLDMLEAFISYGADLNIDDHASERPLYEAAYWGELDAIRIIIDHVSAIDDDNKWGRTALHAAAWAGQTDVVQFLLEHGADPHRKDKHDRTPLLFACFTHLKHISQREAHEATSELLITRQVASGASFEQINPVTKKGRTPLREASGRGFLKVVQLIIESMKPEHKECINWVDKARKRSALHSASVHGRAEVVDVLLRNGADPLLRDSDDKTSFQLCLDQWSMIGADRYQETMLFLIDACVQEASHNRLLVTTAAVQGSVSVLQKLADLGVDLQVPDAYGWTPSQLTSQFGHVEATKLLRRDLVRRALRPKQWISDVKINVTELQEAGSRVIHKTETKVVLIADHPVPAGWPVYYYEVEVLNVDTGESIGEPTSGEGVMPIVAVGFCTSAAKFYEFPGWQPKNNIVNAHSWAYHGDDGGFFSGKAGPPRGPTYGPGDTVGCGFDMESNQIFFTRNGVKLDHVFDDVKGRLFPVLGLDHKVQLRTTFWNGAERDFKWNPDQHDSVAG